MSTISKLIKRIVSLVMVVTLVGTNYVFAGNASDITAPVAFEDAIAKFGDLSLVDDNTKVCDMAEVSFPGNRKMVVSELSNEDTLMCMYSMDGGLIYTSYFDYSAGKMYTVNENEPGTVITTIKKQNNVSEPAGFLNNILSGERYIPSDADTGARVKIATYDNGAFMMNLDIDIGGFETISHKTNVDISGYYYNEADLASSLCMDLFNSGNPMAVFAAYIVAVYAGVEYGMAFTLTNVRVNCDKIFVQWKTNDLLSNSNGTLSGTRYVCYNSNFGPIYKNTGYYYPIGSLISRNNTLAVNCFNTVYPGADASVVSWSNVW